MMSSLLRERADGKQHIRYGIERVEKFGHRAPVKLTLKEVRRILSTWQLWLFVASYT